MLTSQMARDRVAKRGPRYAVIGSIRPGEATVMYADTAAGAESAREDFEGLGYYQVRVHPPLGSVNLAELGEARRAAKAALDEATAVLRAGVLRAAEEGRAEAEIARTAGLDRMTVRSWLGK